MAILEINLEKPAIVEEYQYPGKTPVGSGETEASESSGRGLGSLVGLLVVLAGVGLLVRRLRNRGSSQTDAPESETLERGPESGVETEASSGRRRRVAGILGFAVAVVSFAAAVRKVRG